MVLSLAKEAIANLENSNEKIKPIELEKNDVIADLHIHSRYSRATSKNLTVENLVKYARIKGLSLLGTGDISHEKWLKEIREKLKEKDKTGIYYFKDEKGEFPFVLSGEISLVFSKNGKGRRVHLVYLVPNFEVNDKINKYLDTKGRRDYDGRPIFPISCEDFVREMKKISDKIEIIPAHVWTPWFGVFGSESGFDSLKETFGEQEKNIHAIETGMSCYDKETEVLTNRGWKKVSQVISSDEICTLNLEKDLIEFQKPLKLFKYNYNGKMYKLKTKRVDLLVTPNHKLLCSHCNFRKKPKFILKEARLLFNKSMRFKKDGNWIGTNPDYFILPEVKVPNESRFYSGLRNIKEKKLPIKDWLKFFGFWIAKGYTSQGKDGDYGTYIANKNKSIIKEMRLLLEGFGYNVYQYESRGLQILKIMDFQLFSYLRKFGMEAKKFIPAEVKVLSKEFLEIFFKYYIKGNGNVYGRNNRGLHAITISKKLRDDLQDIALRLGMSAYYKLHNKKGTSIGSLYKARKKGYVQSKDSWIIYFIRKNIHTVMPSTIKKGNYIEKWENYNGKVYCLEVPNHIIYIRRNGIPVWCGNSDPEMNWKIAELGEKAIISFSDSHSFWPWRLGREATIFSFKEEKLTYENLIGQIRNRTFKSTIETDPAYGKYHWDGHRNCNFSCSPEKTRELKGLCPICKKPLTIGVENRVEKLKNFSGIPKNAKAFYKLLPLHELIAFYLKTKIESKKTWEIYNKLIEKFGTEFDILLKIDRNVLTAQLTKEKLDGLADLIIDNRIANLKVQPGYDGEYGKLVEKTEQKKLF